MIVMAYMVPFISTIYSIFLPLLTSLPISHLYRKRSKLVDLTVTPVAEIDLTKDKCHVCLEEDLDCDFQCQNCGVTACNECYEGHIRSLEGNIRSTCIDKTCVYIDNRVLVRYRKAIDETTPVSKGQDLEAAIHASTSLEDNMTNVLQIAAMSSDSPCCKKPYVSTGCMSIICNDCKAHYCGFCHLFVHQIPEPNMPTHVSVCPKNPNEFITVLQGFAVHRLDHKDPYVTNFMLFQVNRRMVVFNEKVNLMMVEKHGLENVFRWITEHDKEVKEAIGEIYLDTDKYDISITIMGFTKRVIVGALRRRPRIRPRDPEDADTNLRPHQRFRNDMGGFRGLR